MRNSKITLSVVSHAQNSLVNALLADLGRLALPNLQVLVTENVPDPAAIQAAGLPFQVERIVGTAPRGFGANHNRAFGRCASEFFCVCNPDVRLPGDPFPALLEALADPGVGVAGPLVCDPSGRVEDSARRFPTPAALARKLFSDRREPDYPADRGLQRVDWVAGMFMLFRAESYRAMGGFDERYFLYYEDVDLCRRLRAAGLEAAYVPASRIVHDARRGSRRNPRLAAHHLRSAFRFLAGF